MSGSASRAAARALGFQLEKLPSERQHISPKTARLEAHIQSEPPRVPVNSYHCARLRVLAKELPRVSQGQEIWAEK